MSEFAGKPRPSGRGAVIDWERLLTDHNIPYITSGPNVGRGNIGFKCPFCSELDPSFHGGVNLTTGKWNCWRDSSHKGTTPTYLLSALLGISTGQARLVIEAYSNTALDDFDTLTSFKSAPEAPHKVIIPDEFIPIRQGTLTHKFWVYLQNRGFDLPDKVIEDYDLKCCLVGRWKGRIIIPVYNNKNYLIGWQGRSLRTIENVPRYLTSNENVKRTLFNLQNLNSNAETLYICEGPFDALRIDYFGKPRIRATCLFGATPTPEQIELLYKLSSKFAHLILLLDADATGITAGFSLSDWLPMASFGSLPEGHKDTDRMSPQEIKLWLKSDTHFN